MSKTTDKQGDGMAVDVADDRISIPQAAALMGVSRTLAFDLVNRGSRWGDEVIKLQVVAPSPGRVFTTRRWIAEYEAKCSVARQRIVNAKENPKLLPHAVGNAAARRGLKALGAS